MGSWEATVGDVGFCQLEADILRHLPPTAPFLADLPRLTPLEKRCEARLGGQQGQGHPSGAPQH
eukprot:4649708-Alexandrium_andersonii.AAC.1